jgi:hypothetical protein
MSSPRNTPYEQDYSAFDRAADHLICDVTGQDYDRFVDDYNRQNSYNSSQAPDWHRRKDDD